MEQKVTENKVNLQKEIEKVNDYKYKQSGKGSDLIRKIVIAIIGSCWILMFAKGKYQETNIFLKVTIACSFVYLLLDVFHYLLDTCSYHTHAQIMEQCTTSDYYEHIYKPDDLKISRRSFGFFISKVVACFAVSGAFLLGMFIEPLYDKKSMQPPRQTQTEKCVNTSVQEKWKYKQTADGHDWILFSDDKGTSKQIMTIHFDAQSGAQNIDF